MDQIRTELFEALQEAGQLHVSEEEVELMYNAVWLVAREETPPQSAASTPPFWWRARRSSGGGSSSDSSDSDSASASSYRGRSRACVQSPSSSSSSSRAGPVLSSAAVECWMRLNFTMSAQSGARERADELIESCAQLIGWRRGVHDAGMVSFDAVPDGAPEVSRWWASCGTEWQSLFGRVERKPTFSAANLIAAFNAAALDRYGVMVWRLPRAQGYALKNVHFLSSWDVRTDQRASDFVQSSAERVLSGQDAWPPHDWFLSVDDESGLRLARACVSRLRQHSGSSASSSASSASSSASSSAQERARRFLSAKSVDVCDASFRLLDFFAQGLHEELERSIAADDVEARGPLCLLTALYRYCMETICLPLHCDVKRGKRRMAAAAADATGAAADARETRLQTLHRRESDSSSSSSAPAVVVSSDLVDDFLLVRRPVSSSSSAPTSAATVADRTSSSLSSTSSSCSATTKTTSTQAQASSSFVSGASPSMPSASSARVGGGGRVAVQCWYRGVRYDSITEAKVSVFLQELCRVYGGACVSLDIKPGMVEVSGLLTLLRRRVGNVSYVPDALESARWHPDFGLCLGGINYWVEVKYHASRLLIGEQEKYHVVGAADRPVLLLSVDNGSIQPPYSTGRREYSSASAAAAGSGSNSSAGITITCFRGGRRYDVVFAERADGVGGLDLFPCPEDLCAIRALAWNAPKLLAAYSAAHGIERVYCARPDQESSSVSDKLCIQQS